MSKISPDQVQLLRSRLARNALSGLSGVDGLTALQMFRTGVFDSLGEPEMSPHVLQQLASGPAPQFESVIPGPLFPVEVEEGVQVVDLPEQLITSNVETRKVLVRRLKEACAQSPRLCRPVLDAIDANHINLFSEDIESWSESVLDLYERIRVNVGIAQLRLIQSLVLRVEGGYSEYTQKALRPSSESIMEVVPDLLHPTAQYDEIRLAFQSLRDQSTSIEELLTGFEAILSFIQVPSDLSLACLIEDWLSLHNEELSSTLEYLRDCETQNLIMEGHLIHAEMYLTWNHARSEAPLDRFLSLTGRRNSNEGGFDKRILLAEMARHFAHHMECVFPNREAAPLTTMSWWFASETLSTVLESNIDQERFFEVVLLRERNLSQEIWMEARPSAGPFPGRFMTLFTNEYWQYYWVDSARRLLGYEFTKELTSFDEDSIAFQVKSWLGLGVPTSFGADTMDSSNPDFDHQSPPATALTLSAGITDETLSEEVSAYLDAYKRAYDKQRLPELMAEIADRSLADQYLIATYLRSSLYAGVLAATSACKVMDNENWLSQVVVGTDLEVLELMLDALHEASVQAGDPWVYRLPHLLVGILEKSGGLDDERTELILSSVILCSIHSDSRSPIVRLEKRLASEDLSSFRSDWAERMRNAATSAPRWISNRFQVLAGVLEGNPPRDRE